MFKPRPVSLDQLWEVQTVTDDGLLFAQNQQAGFVFQLDGLDGLFLSSDQSQRLHEDWRSILKLDAGEELQLLFRKRVEFSDWVEQQLAQSFLAESSYGRRILLERLSEQVEQMGVEPPSLLSQRILAVFWTRDLDGHAEPLRDKRSLVQAQLKAFGFNVRAMNQEQIAQEIQMSAQDHKASDHQTPEWPALKIEAGQLRVNEDRFRALELIKLPETFTELGMIQALTSLPYPIDISLRLLGCDQHPVLQQLKRKRNLLQAKASNTSARSAEAEAQLNQIDRVLAVLAESSESVLKMKLTIGLRFPLSLEAFHRKAMATLQRAAAQMGFCELEESTINTFDSYLECIPGFRGQNIKAHTVLSSNAIHYLPFFRPASGDARSVITFQTREDGFFSVDPVSPSLANYNWLISGTSGAGKSFFVNSLLAQSITLQPNIFIVDIGGSYSKLTQFLGGRVMSLEPGQGFALSPFFLSKSEDPAEERLRRQHVLQVFLEMTRLDGRLPTLEVRHLLTQTLEKVFEQERLPNRPVTAVLEHLQHNHSPAARHLAMALEPWRHDQFFGQFIDNNSVPDLKERVLTFDLKGLTEFEDLSRVIQLIVCSHLWAKIRQTKGERFSWIVLDEVAFSLLKTQSSFVDELVSTLRKYYAGAVVVVQDLEKITSNPAGASILQNSQSKAILQQRGQAKTYAEALSLSQADQWAIDSLRREKGSYSDVFLIRDSERAIIRHSPTELEYWLATTAPEDCQVLNQYLKSHPGSFQKKILDFSSDRATRSS